jgi:hypothetical protein
MPGQACSRRSGSPICSSLCASTSPPRRGSFRSVRLAQSSPRLPYNMASSARLTGWPIRRPIAESEHDWSTGFAKFITSESSADTVENQTGSDLIQGDEPALALPRKAHDGPSAVAVILCGVAATSLPSSRMFAGSGIWTVLRRGQRPLVCWASRWSRYRACYWRLCPCAGQSASRPRLPPFTKTTR